MFRRRAAVEPTEEDLEQELAKQGGKGRPTPKRKESQRGRRPLGAPPPKDRKEASRRQRELTKEYRAKSRLAMEGDEKLAKYLPPRDRGPVRRFARDFIDARRSPAEYFLVAAMLILVLSFIPSPGIQLTAMAVWLGMIALIVVDSFIVVRKLKRETARRFPDEGTRGVSAYAIIRSLQLRALRMPKPSVKRGAAL